jgi:hypothetical protein
MKGTISVISALVSLTLFFSSAALAAPIAASTELAIAKDLEVKINRVNANDGSWDAKTVDALEFGALNFKSGTDGNGKQWTLFLPDYYFAIDVSAKKGSLPVNGSIQVTYVEGSNPNSPGHGLGYKATITYCNTYFASKGDLKNKKTTDSVLGKVLIKDGFALPVSAIKGGWLRLYVGIATLDPNAALPDPSGAEVFSPADKSGDYSGGIVVTLI